MRRLIRRAVSLGLYVLVPAMSAIASLLVIPVVTARYGAEAWASVAIGLSVGLGGAVIGELGWSIVGPQRVARDPGGARTLYDRALASRFAVTLPLAAACGVAAAVLTTEHRAAAALLAVGVALGALSPSWFCTGLNRPGVTLVAESLPRLVFTAVAATAIALGAPLEVYGAALIAAVVVALVVTTRILRVRVVPTGPAIRSVPGVIRAQLVLVTGRGVTTLYKALPTAILAAVAPDLVALYAAVDRPLRLGLQFLAALPQRLQAWVAVDEPALRSRRLRLAVLANAALGVFAGAVFAVLMPLVAPVLFSGTVAVPALASIVAGGLVAAICTSRGFGLTLVAEGRSKHTTTAALASAVVGLPGTVVGALLGGVPGVLLALVVAETVGVLVQWCMLSWTGRDGAVAPREVCS